jgi:hypothetical protein
VSWWASVWQVFAVQYAVAKLLEVCEAYVNGYIA